MTPSKVAANREWCAYIRVSKLNGREGESFVSPSQQEAKIRAALRTKYDTEPSEVWADLDKTGTDDNRLQFAEAIAWVEADPGHRGIAVMDGSRLFRNAELFMTTVKRLERKGAEYLSAHLLLDAKTPEGALMRNMDAVINEFFSANIGRRWRMVQADRLDNGLPTGGPVRFGYVVEKTDDGKVLDRIQQPHPDNGPVLAQMYADFIAGKGAQKIAKGLNDRGVRSPRGNDWNIQGVLRTLDSGFGAGKIKTVEDGGVVYREGAHTPVIDEATWEHYLRVRAARRMEAPRHKSPQWHLAKLARCGLCGSNLLVASYLDPKTLVSCSKYKSSRTCTGVWISKASLDRAVFWWLGTQMDQLAKHAGSGKQRERAYSKATLAVEKAKARLEKLTKEKIGTARLHAAGDLSAGEYRSALAENEAEMAEASRALAESQADVDRLAPVDDEFETLIQWGEQHKDPAEYNVLLSKVIDRVEVTKRTITIYPVTGKPHDVPRL